MKTKTDKDIGSVIRAAIESDKREQIAAKNDNSVIRYMRRIDCPLANALADVCAFSDADKFKVQQNWSSLWDYYKQLAE